MAYLGNTQQIQSYATDYQSFDGDGSTLAFILQRSVALATDIEVYVENVRQQPYSAYTVSGTTLTFTGAPPAGTKNVYVVYIAKNVVGMQPAQLSVSPGMLSLGGPSWGVDGQLKINTTNINGLLINQTSGDGTAMNYIQLNDTVGMKGFIGFADTTNSMYFANYKTAGRVELRHKPGLAGLTIENSGAVTKPLQPAFHVYSPAAGAAGAVATFGGSDSAFNGRNSGWNGSSRYTAPIAGLYLFAYCILIGKSGGTYGRLNFRINGSIRMDYGDTLNDGYDSYAACANSAVIYLNVGDYVELWNEGAEIYGVSYGGFSGTFLG